MSRILFLSLLAAAVFAGCATETSGYYKNSRDDAFGRKETFEYPQKSQAIAEMVGRLLTDPDFTDLYSTAMARAQKRGHKRPTVIIREIEDNTQAGGSDARSTRQVRTELKAALRKTRMFAVIDTYERAKMTNVVLHDIDAGAKADNNESFGEYESGDFVMFGELSKDNVGGRVYYHFLNLRMIDPVTGTEIWSDTVKVTKE